MTTLRQRKQNKGKIFNWYGCNMPHGQRMFSLGHVELILNIPLHRTCNKASSVMPLSSRKIGCQVASRTLFIKNITNIQVVKKKTKKKQALTFMTGMRVPKIPLMYILNG